MQSYLTSNNVPNKDAQRPTCISTYISTNAAVVRKVRPVLGVRMRTATYNPTEKFRKIRLQLVQVSLWYVSHLFRVTPHATSFHY